MDIWYALVNTFLPFEWTQYEFMKNALLAVLIITPVFGILSTMIVNNRMAFFSDSIGHSTLTGVGIGVILGVKSPLLSMIVFSAIFAVFIVVFKNANTASTDTVIGVFSSIAISLGLVIILKNSANLQKYLIGDILSITAFDILLLFIVLCVVMFFWIFIFNKLMIVSINQSLASSRGLNVQLMEIVFTVIIAVIVTISIQWVGLLIINSLLVLPAAAARNISGNVRQYHVISLLIAIISGVSGLILSYYWGTATGATIVLISAGFYFATFFLKRKIA
ncbi:MAG: metal ABC transporter permease [Clostridia bacterium]|nr:metal ABC transporter permease [Clostridia bacterium]